MFNEVQGLLGRVTGGDVDTQAVQSAAADHISGMNHTQLTQELQTAAGSAETNGQSGVAQQIMGLLSQHGSDPQGLKDQAITLIKNNPQILEHFAPDFARGILSKI